ncbi:amino acid adenylation domain-containing protein [Kitasatospora sp. NPDC093806]|uniref:amino acid adenylation domain-containing protein n=1 Tax=Kitasatospora sp. NPDC093806 TaxID=3155075 RepID=UPI0034223AB9
MTSTVHGLVEAQARRSPDAVALEFEGVEVSYRELDRRANRLAHRLRALGAGPERVVAVGAQRSPELVVALLGILKSGAAYLPLDLELPADRLASMVDRTAPVALVRGPGLDPALDLGTELPEVLLDGVTDDTAGAADGPCGVPVDGRNPAYVMFTSGSTGKPKGVVVEHLSVCNRLRWGQHEYGMTPDERVLQKTPYAFDVSVWELFWPLTVGARLVIARPGGHRDGSYLVELIQRRGITTVHFIPTMLGLFAGERGVADCLGLRRVLTSGEELPTDLQNRVLRLLPHIELHNLYGPTETTIEVSAWQCRPEWPGRSVPIGAAVDNSRMHILDPQLRQVPDDGTGELFLSGVQLARGYLGQPGLTAERFLPDPYGEPGGRMYRSGDLAAWHRPGVAEFLGRADDQLKLGGNRVELGEIQAVLHELPGVRTAVVVAAGSAAEQRIVAYAVGDGLDVGDLREGLAARLPGYMVPSAFVLLDALPLTPNGKLDRRALPAPDRPELAIPYRAPAPGLQERLAAVWAALFSVDRIGADDDFFALGGQSMLAVRLIARLREELGADVALRDLFEAPTVAGLAAALERAGTGAGAGTGPARPALTRGGDDEPVVASSGQERLLFLHELHPDSPGYVIPIAWRVAGRLDPTLLRGSLERLAARHDALRTRFPGGDRPPVIGPEPVVDLRLAEAGEWDEELAAAELRRPFDLAAGPAWRAVLFRLPGQDVLLLVLHHLVADGWSLGVIARELGELYAGGTPPLPPVRYADFARHQRAELTPARLADRLAWWRATLTGVPVLELPTDRPRPAVLGTDGATLRFALPQEALRTLEQLARDGSTTLHTLLLAVFQVLLGRWSGQRDFAVGTAAAGRAHAELEHVVGFFANTLAVRADLAGDPTLDELLGRVREAVLGAYDHQDVPFERVVEELRPDRDLSRNPVFQTMFALRDATAALRLPGLAAEELPLGWRTAKFDLTLFVDRAADGGCTGLFEYATDLFDAATVERLAAGFGRLLLAIAERPDGRLGDWDLLDPAEAARLVAAGTAPRPPIEPLPLHRLVADRAAAQGERPALVDGPVVWTYADLDARANRLAHHLISLGAGPETVVAVSLPRGAELVAAQLAVLKAGAAYLPLDADQPAERSRHLLAESGARLLIGDAGRPALGCRVVDLAREAATIDRLPDTAPEVAVGPDHLAFLVYTSGSTGRPKGVAISHRALVRTVRAGSHLALGPEDRVALAASPVFDAATFEVWATLVAGAALVVTPPDVVLSPDALAGHLERHRVTTLFLTTALFNQVVRERPRALAALRTVLFGGEAADPLAVGALLAEAGGPDRLLHMYGPAESTTFGTWHLVDGRDRGAAGVPIGRPVDNTTAYVVDERLRPVPVGVVGELLLGGAGLARGYAGAPGRTAERFLPDPFGPPGARVYRTGDLVRWDARGRLEFVGRADGQVKVRGFRVEPGEVEGAVRRHPAVRDTVVVARPDRSGALALVAYAVGDRAALDGLAGFLAERLPAYLVPSAVVVLDELPLTRNGKVDRAALPAPVHTPAGRGRRPAAGLERELAAVWSEVLGVDEPGAEDDFFDLGGHSLLAIRVVGAVAERTGRQLTFRDLFTARTISGLAKLLDDAGSGPAADGPIRRGTGDTGLPASFGQERLVFLDRLEEAGVAYTIPVAWRLTGPLDEARLAAALDALVARHEVLRTRFALADGVLTQDIRPGWAGLDVRAAGSAAEAERALREEARVPFDVVGGPLFRAVLWRIGAAEHVLLLALHHTVADGWSAGLLVRDLQACHDGAALPELPVRYADFARWQRERLGGDGPAAELAHWRERLAGLPTLELPTDRPRPAVRTGAGDSVAFTVGPELTARLEELGRAHGATLFMTLLAAYQVLLGRWSGQADFGVGTPVAGRGRPEVRDVVGFFLDTLVLRADLTGDPGFTELLDRVRTDALGAYEHQDVPFGRLVEELHPERELNRTPLFQAMFSFNDWNLDTLRLGPVTGTAVPVDRGAAKLDLTLELVHGPDGLAGALDFTTDILDAAAVGRMAEAYTAILREAVATPTARIGALLPVPPQPAAPARTAPARPLLERIADHVRDTPEAPAVLDGGVRLGYAELDRRANRLAHHLLALGAGPEDRIGLRLRRGADTVAAVLGVWKAGGAYVALDPDLPEARTARIAEDAGLRLVIDETTLADPALRLRPDTAPDTAPAPDGLAYLVYTSGSTGAPKGVSAAFDTVTDYLDTVLAHYRLTRADVVLQRASPSFDAFLRDCVGPLTVGATVLLAGQSDLSGLAEDLAHPGTPAPTAVLSMVPSLLHQLIDGGEFTAERLPALRLLVLSGEARTPELLARLHRALPGLRRVVNHYGPTECTLTTTVEDLDPALPVRPGSIGRPMPGTAVQVLDAALRPVPTGVFGELYIGGAGLTRGYHGRPGLTAAAFVPDPFGPPGARLYRTGDRGRRLADGTLEFAGRLDRQVKVRGVRIEPAEVEAALAAHPGVGAAAVVARPDGPNGWRLTGYAQRVPGAPLTVAGLRTHLETVLPYAMVPAALVVLNALPLLGNGKVDRAALPEPAAPGGAAAHVAPRTATERALAEVWAELLHRPDIGVEDDFFDLGGHSLTAMRVISRLRSRLDATVTLRAFFEARTIAGLARKLEEH